MIDLRYLKLLTFLAMSQALAGRRYISSKLGMGEGVVRGLIELGRGLGHISVNRAGAKITDNGIRYLAEVISLCRLKPLAYTNKFAEKLCGRVCVAFSLGIKIDNIVKFRDSVVRRGSCGTIIAQLRDNNIYIPLAEMRLEDLDPEMANSIKGLLSREDFLIISCGDNFGQALAPLEVVCEMMIEPGRSDEVRHPI